jgi:hypothetical protein
MVMLDTETLETHIRRLKALFWELANVDLSVPTEIKVMILLDSLPNSYLGYVQAISARDSSITFAQLETKLLVEESRMKLQLAHQPAEQVLMVKGKTNIQHYKPPAQCDSHHGPSSTNMIFLLLYKVITLTTLKNIRVLYTSIYL